MSLEGREGGREGKEGNMKEGGREEGEGMEGDWEREEGRGGRLGREGGK